MQQDTEAAHQRGIVPREDQNGARRRQMDDADPSLRRRGVTDDRGTDAAAERKESPLPVTENGRKGQAHRS